LSNAREITDRKRAALEELAAGQRPGESWRAWGSRAVALVEEVRS
jgi:hypothetical protein